MRAAESVITEAVNGHTDRLAEMFEVGEPRMYQLLSTHCAYPRTKRLIRAIAVVNPDGARLIKADLDAMFADILSPVADVPIAEIHRDAFAVVQDALENEPTAIQKTDLRKLIAAAESRLESLDSPDFSPRAEVEQFRAKRG